MALKPSSDNGPYSLDVVQHPFKNTIVNTIVNSPVYDTLIPNLDTAYEYDVGYVPAGYEHRPDLISNVFYGSPKNWWLLMLVNNINDPFEGFRTNQRILIPKL
jgi:hypothetical protein